MSDGKTDTPETDAARAGCYFGCNLERERDSYHAAYDGAAEACRAFKRERDLALRRVKELEAMVTRLVELVAECGECPPNTGICTKTITCDDCIRDWAKGEPK